MGHIFMVALGGAMSVFTIAMLIAFARAEEAEGQLFYFTLAVLGGSIAAVTIHAVV